MKNLLASAQGKIIDWKHLETEKGKTLAHLQLEDDDKRISWVLVPAAAYKKWQPVLEEAYRNSEEIEIRGKKEDFGTQVRLVAEEIFRSHS